MSLGDKEKSFIGTSKWIGSYELNLCLEKLFEVASKILFVHSGSEIPTLSRQLQHHFESEGTPIMIGGGALAYTLLGIDYNEGTGEVQFLILDPHYEGPDDMKTIVGKGWCGWKGPDLFHPDAFYNFCLPQRPRIV